MGQATWTYFKDKSIVDHAKAICSRNFYAKNWKKK